MAKKHPEPFWRSERNCYFVQIGKKQVKLSADRDEAFRLYHQLMSKPPETRVATTHPSTYVVELLDAFLEWSKIHRAEKTYTWYRDNIQVFVAAIPKDLAVTDLKPYHVTRVMDAQTTWSASTKNGFARSIQRGMNWAEAQGLIDRTPIARVEKPKGESRELVITSSEFDDLLARFPDQDFRDVLITVWETGCRPQEMMAVEACHVDLANNRWVFKIKESKGKKVSRIVYLTDRAAAITRRLVEQYPTGKLFRNADGEPWDKDAINRRFLRKKKALGRKLCLYNIRHSFAQRMLLAGVDALIVATWLGHKDTAMLARVYSHLQQDPDYLHAKLRDANASMISSPANASV
jgi:integrase